MSATPAYDRAAELRALDATLAGVRGLVASGTAHVPRIFRVPGPEEPLQARGGRPAQEPSAATVPVIDLSGCGDGDRAGVVDSIRRAAAEWGFFQVTGHGVPGEAMAAAVAAVRAFHDADGGEGSDKARLYSREPGKAVKYHCNFDLYQSPVANWRDTLYLRMAPDPPAAEELPKSCRDFFDALQQPAGIGFGEQEGTPGLEGGPGEAIGRGGVAAMAPPDPRERKRAVGGVGGGGDRNGLIRWCWAAAADPAAAGDGGGS